MRTLITGVSGFVGRYLSERLLASGAIVYGVSRHPAARTDDTDRFTMIAADLRDRRQVREALALANPEVVFHLAAQSSVPDAWADPAETIANNVCGEANLLQSLVDLRMDPIVVSVGSSDCYGRVAPEENPVAEATPMRPVNPYGVSKAAQDLLGYQYHASHGLRIVRLRPFNHIGPGQSDRFVVSAFARQIAEIEVGRRPPELTTGDLTAERDFTDVRDIVAAYVLAADRCTWGDAYNIGSGHGTVIRDLLDALLGMARVPIAVRLDLARLRPVDLPRLLCDSAKFRLATGWTPDIPLAQSLADTLAYWRGLVPHST